MSETSTDVVWLTQEAYDKLEAELNNLKLVGRPDVTARIASAREEGDLSENGGYHAAREEQGQMEGRIRQLEHLLRRAQVGEPEGAHDEVAPGKVITVAYDGDPDDTETFLLGSREILGSDSSISHAVSPQAPLGAAVVGAKLGDEVRYEAPNGREIMVVVTGITTL
ncbi:MULTISPECIES: transcription elongation factor GreA [unclassified Tessaracoccus]|uniref:transcription elongation factor GreA n=1 Tax=unclassified Tessaracoccus TaxID=2635419 RepID=UPI001600031F|nr:MULTISPECIES: transcription elongation factor GreA [unclassified Tessaracoccus]MBB1511898.1 transcription elongation factor GreA [Tessaracoccus sp. MC1627]MBB1514415.1 transcription elongation factor GreA [Tessaracoccus sp. MC1679]